MTAPPPPATPASLGRRLAAYAIDQLVILVLLGAAYALLVAGFVNGSPALMTVGAIAVIVVGIGYPVAYVVGQGRSGSTPGKRALGLRTVDAESGAPIGFGRALLRQLVLGLAGPVNVVQLVTIPRHPRRQGWHDAAARSVVVLAPRPGERPTPPAATPAPPADRPASPGALPHLATAPASSPPATAVPAPPVVAPPAVVVAPPPSGPAPTSDAPAVVAPPPVAATTTVGPPPTRVTRPAPVTTLPTWVLASPTQHHVLAGSVLAGRDPDPALVAGATTWAIDDPDLSVSKTHALIGVDGGTPWVEDWHSTNGTVLERDGESRAVGAHERTGLHDGDVVVLGQLRLTVRKEHG